MRTPHLTKPAYAVLRNLLRFDTISPHSDCPDQRVYGRVLEELLYTKCIVEDKLDSGEYVLTNIGWAVLGEADEC